METYKIQGRRVDHWLLILILALTCFGVLMVYNTSIVSAFRDFQDKYFYARQQIIWASIGLVFMLICSQINYRFWVKFAPIFLVGTIILLVLVLIPGVSDRVLGARRWIGIGGLNVQPAEAAKLSLILYFSSLLSKKPKILPLLVILGLFVALVMLEPDLGTTVVIVMTSLSLFFASGASLVSLTMLGAISFIMGIFLILTSAYRKSRLLTFLDLSRDPLGSSYHIRQILLALGSGGLFGVGLGASRQKYEYLPESMTDSIFAIIGEEMGFIGALFLVVIFLFLVWRGLKIAKESPDKFGQLSAVGITSWIGVQVLVNLAGMVALVPLTGVPLPFISYGGSSLVVSLVGMGILLNISKYRAKK